MFDLGNYLFFIILVAAIYVVIVNFAQARIGGKNRLVVLQQEMRENQKKMIEATKNKNTAESDALMNQYWKMTSELMGIQLKLTGVFLVVFLSLAALFPYIEPTGNDDISLQLYDNGLAANCDLLAGDGLYSGCLALPKNTNKGAWVVDIHLKSSSNETLAKNATALYVDGGKPEDIWLQASSQNGLFDGLLGKTAHYVNITADKANVTRGETIPLHATASSLPEGARMEAVANSGTFLYLDLPFSIPLINIRRIIGSYGLFIFLAFVISMVYSIGKAFHSKLSKKNEPPKN